MNPRRDLSLYFTRAQRVRIIVRRRDRREFFVGAWQARTILLIAEGYALVARLRPGALS